MARTSITLTQLTYPLGLFFILALTFGPTLATVLQALGVHLIFIIRFTLLLPNREASRFGARVLKGNITQFDNLYFYEESLPAVPSNRLREGAFRLFMTPRPFGLFFGGFPRTCF